MTYRVILAPRARRDLDKIPPRIVGAIVAFMFGDLAAHPHRVDKPLRFDLEGAMGARRGPYRLIYDVDDAEQIVLVLRIAHRSEVYRPD